MGANNIELAEFNSARMAAQIANSKPFDANPLWPNRNIKTTWLKVKNNMDALLVTSNASNTLEQNKSNNNDKNNNLPDEADKFESSVDQFFYYATQFSIIDVTFKSRYFNTNYDYDQLNGFTVRGERPQSFNYAEPVLIELIRTKNYEILEQYTTFFFPNDEINLLVFKRKLVSSLAVKLGIDFLFIKYDYDGFFKFCSWLNLNENDQVYI